MPSKFESRMTGWYESADARQHHVLIEAQPNLEIYPYPPGGQPMRDLRSDYFTWSIFYSIQSLHSYGRQVR